MLLLLLVACCTPPEDGPLADGEWADPDADVGLAVSEGLATLHIGCTSGDGEVTVTAGRLEGTFSFDPDSWGPDSQEEEDAVEVTVSAEVCGSRIEGAATSADEDAVAAASFAMRSGAARDLQDCPQ